MRRLDHSLDERDELSRLVIAELAREPGPFAELAREPGFLEEEKRRLAFPYELSRLMKAELARELGLFEEAKRLLAFPFDKPYRHAVKVISDLAEQNHTGVGGIRGDEALSQEEIRLIEESKEESKARLRALEASLRAAEEAKKRIDTNGETARLAPSVGLSMPGTVPNAVIAIVAFPDGNPGLETGTRAGNRCAASY